ncbi:MAG: hypothetical protein WD077_13040 [Bacteroidia bacterium]
MKKLFAVLAIAGFMAGSFTSCSRDRCPTVLDGDKLEQLNEQG